MVNLVIMPHTLIIIVQMDAVTPNPKNLRELLHRQKIFLGNMTIGKECQNSGRVLQVFDPPDRHYSSDKG